VPAAPQGVGSASVCQVGVARGMAARLLAIHTAFVRAPGEPPSRTSLRSIGINPALAAASTLLCGALSANHAPRIRTSLLDWLVAGLPNLDEEYPCVSRANVMRSSGWVSSELWGTRKTSVFRFWQPWRNSSV
jgi:hypothetical protein